MSTSWGPENPHPLSRLGTELVWAGKYDEHGRRRTGRLPGGPLRMACLEQIDGPVRCPPPAAGVPPSGETRNTLVWGDNRLAMAALLDRYRGQVDLIYIDPPFDSGADLRMRLALGDDMPGLEAVAYRDRWGTDADSYLQMMYERLLLMKELLAERGNLFVHVDYRANSPIRLVLDDVFGPEMVNEIVWHYNSGPRAGNAFGKRHDTLYRYARDATRAFMATDIEPAREPYSPDINIPASKAHYYHPLGKVKGDVWRLSILGQNDKRERTGFARQKPEALLQQIIAVCCPENGLVADLFCGSGTTLAVAEKLGRRWIGVDWGRQAIAICRKRLSGVQRALHAAGRPHRPFDLYSLEHSERAWWLAERLAGSGEGYVRRILQAYGARPQTDPPGAFQGVRGEALVHVAGIDTSLRAADLWALARAAGAVGGGALHCLAWEMEPDLARAGQVVADETGLALRLLLIPHEIMEPNRGDLSFYEPGRLDARAVSTRAGWDVELVGLVPGLAERQGAALRSPLDFVDFWAVDFDYEEGRPFKHHWQAFRTRAERRLPVRSSSGWTYAEPGPHRIAVKAIDVLGADSTTIIDVEV